MGNLSINIIFSPSRNTYWGAAPPGPSPSYSTDVWNYCQFKCSEIQFVSHWQLVTPEVVRSLKKKVNDKVMWGEREGGGGYTSMRGLGTLPILDRGMSRDTCNAD